MPEPAIEYSTADLEAAEKYLSTLLEKRNLLMNNLTSIENSIYNLETFYIQDTTFGNVIKGYEGFLTQRTPAARRNRPTEGERIFSKSSSTYQAPQEASPVFDDDRDSADDVYIQGRTKKKRKIQSTIKKKRSASEDYQ